MFKVVPSSMEYVFIIDPKSKGNERHTIVTALKKDMYWLLTENLDQSTEEATLVSIKEISTFFGKGVAAKVKKFFWMQ